MRDNTKELTPREQLAKVIHDSFSDPKPRGMIGGIIYEDTPDALEWFGYDGHVKPLFIADNVIDFLTKIKGHEAKLPEDILLVIREVRDYAEAITSAKEGVPASVAYFCKRVNDLADHAVNDNIALLRFANIEQAWEDAKKAISAQNDVIYDFKISDDEKNKVLEAAAKQFQFYEKVHRAKPDNAKAETNKIFAAMCQDAITNSKASAKQTRLIELCHKAQEFMSSPAESEAKDRAGFSKLLNDFILEIL